MSRNNAIALFAAVFSLTVVVTISLTYTPPPPEPAKAEKHVSLYPRLGGDNKLQMIPLVKEREDLRDFLRALESKDLLTLDQMAAGGRLFYAPRGSRTTLLVEWKGSCQVKLMDNREGWVLTGFLE